MSDYKPISRAFEIFCEETGIIATPEGLEIFRMTFFAGAVSMYRALQFDDVREEVKAEIALHIAENTRGNLNG